MFMSLFRQEYVKGYSHWAYADLDTILGRVHLLTPKQILRDYDIVTIAFGDNYRLYMRGQLTIHRNNEYVNNLWRSCPHLSKFGSRLIRSYRPGQIPAIQQWQFQSAEGCYSRVIADNSNVSVYVAVGQVSDAFGAPLMEKESLSLGWALMRCYLHPPSWAMSSNGWVSEDMRRDMVAYVTGESR